MIVTPTLTFTSEEQVQNRSISIEEIEEQNYVIHRLNPVVPKVLPFSISHITFPQQSQKLKTSKSNTNEKIPNAKRLSKK